MEDKAIIERQQRTLDEDPAFRCWGSWRMRRSHTLRRVLASAHRG